MNFLISGSAGFIGFHLSEFLLKKKHNVYGVDDLNSYYDVKLKNIFMLVHLQSMVEINLSLFQ